MWHPSPFGTHNQVIDPEPAMDPQNLFGHLVGGTDQEAVCREACEVLAEPAIVGGQFLSPAVIGGVFGAEIGLAQAKGLIAGLCDEDLATHGQLRWERLADSTECAAIQLHLSRGNVGRDARTDIPAVAEPG